MSRASCGGVFLTRGHLAATGDGTLRNPFELAPLLAFAALFAVVSTISAAASGYAAGTVATSAVSGTFDVDVAVLSALRLLGSTADLETVGHAVLIALASNAAGRLLVAAATGPVRFWLPLMIATVVAGAAGFAAFVALPHFGWPGATPVVG